MDDFKEKVCDLHMDDWDTLVMRCFPQPYFISFFNHEKIEDVVEMITINMMLENER